MYSHAACRDRVVLDQEKGGNDVLGKLCVGLRQRGKRPLRVEPGGNLQRKVGQILAVDQLDLVHLQFAFAHHGFQHTGAHKTGIGTTCQHGLDDVVLRQAGDDQFGLLVQANTRLAEFVLLHLVGPQRGGVDHCDGFIPEVVQGVDISLFGATDNYPAKYRA